jgi:hypothetical protein
MSIKKNNRFHVLGGHQKGRATFSCAEGQNTTKDNNGLKFSSSWWIVTSGLDIRK